MPAQVHLVMERSIPASAGEPPAPGTAPPASRVYPRECGGTDPNAFEEEEEIGLSPRVRGNPGTLRLAVGCWRSIPASAGEPKTSRTWPDNTTVYPRECGGTGCAAVVASARVGLSPRVRGNHLINTSTFSRQRSIPASAGEPFGFQFFFRRHGVYPRECGGTVVVSTIGDTTTGLSPRVRGNPLLLLPHVHSDRSIPASAGEPLPDHVLPPLVRVYPRECGGTVEGILMADYREGLSPRVRGNRSAAPD